MEKRKLRSRAYPSVPLQEAVDLLQKLTGELGWDLQERGAIGRAWGYGNSGIAARKTAALVHFGLLSLRDGLYYPTELAKQLLAAGQDADALRTSLREACLSPVLFHEIIRRYETVGQVPEDLAEILTRDLGIQENARDEVVEIFLESASYAGILDDQGRFLDEYFEETGRPRPLARPEPAQAAIGGGATVEPIPQREQVFEFPLTEGKWVALRVSGRLNENDLAILQAQLEVLRLQASFNRPAQPVRLLRKEPQG